MMSTTDPPLRFPCGLLLVTVLFVIAVTVAARCAPPATATPPPAHITLTCRAVVVELAQPQRVLLEHLFDDRVRTSGPHHSDAGRHRLSHGAAIGDQVRVTVFPAADGLAHTVVTRSVPMCRWYYPWISGGPHV